VGDHNDSNEQGGQQNAGYYGPDGPLIHHCRSFQTAPACACLVIRMSAGPGICWPFACAALAGSYHAHLAWSSNEGGAA
jgi:hypothetical protein